MTRYIKNVVLSGGSYKGLEYIGVYRYLLERDMVRHIRNFIGVSIGAVFALLWFFDFTPEQMARVFGFIDWRRRNNLRTTLDGITKYYGLDNGIGYMELFELMLYKKTGIKSVTFKQLAELYPDRTIGIGIFNVSKSAFLLANKDTAPDMPIALAIRISISIPFFFDPIEWNGDLWADGGIINNMPVEYFAHDISNTVTFDFVCPAELELKPTSIPSFLLKCLLGLMNGQSIYKRQLFRQSICELHASHKTAINNRQINDLYDFFRFEFTPEMINTLANQGYKDADLYFHPLLDQRSEFSISSVIRHLIWKVINRPLKYC